MKGLTLAVLALCAASAKARIVVLALEAVFHTDEWCAAHHLGEGPSTCINNAGCCYDGRIGICHSCDAHSVEWCETYGGEDTKTCIGFAGCTMDFANADYPKGICTSNVDPASLESDEVTCEEVMRFALNSGNHNIEREKMCQTPEDLETEHCQVDEAGNGPEQFKEGTGIDGGAMNQEQRFPAHQDETTGDGFMEYVPQCYDDGKWNSEQWDQPGTDFKWCVDDNGHEIPDTRMKAAGFARAMTNCDKERKKHGGHQCPNAVTLAIGNGEVMINDHEDVGNCDMRCNTDKDCDDGEWCCYNGCGYSCQMSIIPKASCETIVLDEGLQAANFEAEIPNEHGTLVEIACADGWSGTDPVEIECKHGSWNDYSMECFKDCEPFEVVNARARDYEIKGGGTAHHGDHRKVMCARGYGAVEGSPDAMRFYKEKLECINGAWGERSLECSSCFDAPQDGPKGWWLGKNDRKMPVPRGGVKIMTTIDDKGTEDKSDDEKVPYSETECAMAEGPFGPGRFTPEVKAQEQEDGTHMIDGVWKILQMQQCKLKLGHAFDCLYYSSRPLKCGESKEARDYCRISCRTCDQAQMKYKVKALKNSIAALHNEANRSKWLNSRTRAFKAFPGPLITKTTLQKVAKLVKKGSA